VFQSPVLNGQSAALPITVDTSGATIVTFRVTDGGNGNAWDHADFVITHPEDYELDPAFTKGAAISHDQDYALKDADFVYVKNWSTYTDYGRVYCNDREWMLTNEKLLLTNHARVMHCLPVRRNVELSDEVLDGFSSIVTQQASNRVWAAQAVLSELLTGKQG